MLGISTKKRSELPEIMDEFDFNGKELERVLKSIDQINAALGGHRVSINGIKKIIKPAAHSTFTIVDVGCGSGASLRKLAQWGEKQAIKLQFIGIDANPDCIQIAKKASKEFTNLSFQCMDVFSKKLHTLNVDVFISTLTFHHFKDEKLVQLLQVLQQQANIGIIINDLHRSKLAYVLFKLYGFFFIKSKIAKHDGLISILRGFKQQDFNNYAQQVSIKKHSLKWFWAFRYQWIIQNK